jgi:hypothetical protein
LFKNPRLQDATVKRVLVLNLADVMELQSAAVLFHGETPKEAPKFSIVDSQKEGYVLYIKASSVSPEYLNFLKNLVTSRKLGIKKSEGYIIIYGY